MHEFAADLTRLEDLLDRLADHGPMSTEDVCALWLDLRETRKALSAVLAAVEEEATESLVARVGEVSGKRSELETGAGLVRLRREPSRPRADGRAVALALALPLVNGETGEVIRAVPLDVLTEVLPAVHAEGWTHYPWRWASLAGQLGESYVLLVDETPVEDRRLVIDAGRWP